MNLPTGFCAASKFTIGFLRRMSSSSVGVVPDVKFMGGFCARCQVHGWVLCRMSSSVGVVPDVKFIGGCCAGCQVHQWVLCRMMLELITNNDLADLRRMMLELVTNNDPDLRRMMLEFLTNNNLEENN